jgi:AbrB family transcriptional regulator, stage V sporulation protein T
MKATGMVRRIDDLGRIVIPKEIRRTLRIRENDPLEIFTDREGEVILKKYSPIGDLREFAQEYADSLYESTGHIVMVADRDEIIAVNGTSKKNTMGKRVTPQLEEIMNSRQPFATTGPNENTPVEGFEFKSLIVAPIVNAGDILGAVIICSTETNMTELERKLCETAARFLAKQLE